MSFYLVLFILSSLLSPSLSGEGEDNFWCTILLAWKSVLTCFKHGEYTWNVDDDGDDDDDDDGDVHGVVLVVVVV